MHFRVLVLSTLLPAAALAQQSAPATPASIVVTIESVRVKPTRPEGGGTWDGDAPAETRGANPLCKLLPLAHLAPGVGTGVAMMAPTLCTMATTRGATQAQRDARAPDLFVAIVAGQDTTYRTHIAQDSLSAFFQARFRVPVAGIGPSGLHLFVLDDDGAQQPETIGEVRVSRDDLLEAAVSGRPLVLTDETGAVQKLELTVAARKPQPLERTFAVPTNAPPSTIPDLYVEAGSVLWIAARGNYSAGPLAGIRSAAGRQDPESVPVYSRHTIHSPPFDRAPQGAAIALLGTAQTITPLVVGECAGVVVSTPGHLALGINDDDVGNNSPGPMQFQAIIVDAKPETWARAGQPVPCSQLVEFLNRRRAAQGQRPPPETGGQTP